VQTLTFAAIQTGIGLSEDLSKGIVDRFKSMPLSRAAVLAGRTGADLVRNVVVILVMIAVGYAVGFEFTNGVLGPVLAVGLLLAWGFVFSWVGAFLGLALSSPETVQAAAFPTIFPLVFASSIFVPVETMPGWLQAFVKVNPITLVTDSSGRWPSASRSSCSPSSAGRRWRWPCCWPSSCRCRCGATGAAEDTRRSCGCRGWTTPHLRTYGAPRAAAQDQRGRRAARRQ
jgi:hypothetical protein